MPGWSSAIMTTVPSCGWPAGSRRSSRQWPGGSGGRTGRMTAMASLMTIIGIWDLRADDIRLRPNEPGIRLELGRDVNITAGYVPSKAADEAAAMRKLAEVATEAADELERRTAAREDGRGDD